MKPTLLIATFFTLGLAACSHTNSSTNTPSEQAPTTETLAVLNPVEIGADNLSAYWQAKPTKPVKRYGRPNWLPKGAGKFSYHVLIDEQGQEVSKTLVSSTPEGWMSQAKLDKMPKASYVASETNPEHKPVKVLMTAEVIRMAGKR
ncbi:hypothetical protein L2712_05215 [Shewanella marisflavi]|uniref:hypothetical protein n=1 Tax=Shewanella marisflavi TaxID=260364 RepID=UPI002010195B|nr:hypothetical protein [Shewanella marisflavi]MCL1041043.1 hypothetical protein [Shewanella marisflavi]